MYKWLKSSEHYFDRLLTAAITLWVLKISGALDVSWTAILVCWAVSLIGAITCAGLAAPLAPAEPLIQPTKDHQ